MTVQIPFIKSHTHTHTHTHKGYELIHSLESQDQQVRYIHYEEFSKVIVEVVQHYIVKISQHIPEYIHDLEKTCMLLNNLHALRVDIQEMFNVMGGQEVRVSWSLNRLCRWREERNGGGLERETRLDWGGGGGR